MSDSFIDAHPGRLLASNPTPESNESSLKLLTGNVTWCQAPIRSANLTSTNLICSSTMNRRTVLGSIQPSSSATFLLRHSEPGMSFPGSCSGELASLCQAGADLTI